MEVFDSKGLKGIFEKTKVLISRDIMMISGDITNDGLSTSKVK